MAKQVEIHDRFKITAEVESESLGPLLAQLARMGLQNLHYELITDVVTFRRNGATTHDVSGAEEARQWLTDHPAFAISQLVEHFKATGRTGASARQAIRTLVDKGSLTRLEKGHYRRVVMAMTQPQDGAVPPKKKQTELRKLFTEDGRNEKSASPIVHKMNIEKLIKATGTDGEYEVLKRPVSIKEKDRLRAQARRDAAKAAKLNGQEASANVS